MAYLPVKFPSNFPDFRVTSYIRGDSPSHSKGNTIDIEPIWRPGISQSEKYYQYFYIWNWLATAQTKGVTRFAVPPNCLHYHIENDPSQNAVGYELLTKKNGQCAVQTSSDGRPFIFQEDKRNYNRAKLFRLETQKNIVDRFVNGALQAGYAFLSLTTSNRFLQVSGNGLIDDQALQNILSIYTGSTAAALVSNEAANAWGYNTPTEIKQAAQDQLINIAIWAAILGLGGWLIYKWANKKADRLFDDRPRDQEKIN